ncbi:MAG TPA: hypothetical protein PKD72_16865 [Gemmatales bacterium]|nr:hypothetical protein [Gemmatales bacterium]
MKRTAFSMLIRNKTAKPLTIVVFQEEVWLLTPGDGVSLLCIPDGRDWAMVELWENTVEVHSPGRTRIVLNRGEQRELACDDEASKQGAETQHMKPCFVLRNMAFDRLHIYQEPCTFECTMPKGGQLLFEEYCDPSTDPLVLEIRHQFVRVDSWLPPDDDIRKALAWTSA